MRWDRGIFNGLFGYEHIFVGHVLVPMFHDFVQTSPEKLLNCALSWAELTGFRRSSEILGKVPRHGLPSGKRLHSC